MTVDLYIYEQKEPTRSVLDYVHLLILHLSPDIKSTIKWKVPFYSLENNILYLNPIKRKTGGVEICFARARRFEKGKEHLNFKNRKVVGGVTIYNIEDINEEVLRLLLTEAFHVDKVYKDLSPWK